MVVYPVSHKAFYVYSGRELPRSAAAFPEAGENKRGGGRDAAGGGYTYPELQLAVVIRRRREVAGRRPPPPEAGVTEFRGDPESDP